MKSKIRSSAKVIALAASFFAISAYAGPDGGPRPPRGEGDDHGPRRGPPPEVLEKFDVNKDGKLDETERAAAMAEREKRQAEFVAKYDTNKDGKLDEAERDAAHEKIKAEMLAKYDANKDGKLDEDERANARKDHPGFGRRPGGPGGPGGHGDRPEGRERPEGGKRPDGPRPE